jgi:hypothetical protein
MLGSSSQPEFYWIFVTPFMVLLIKTAFKYVTKIAVFVQEKPDPIARKAAHFDCLRTGLDLAIIGLVATAAAVRFALKTSQQLTRIPDLATRGIVYLLVQFAFVGFTAFLSAVFYSPEKSFIKGVFMPTPLGCLSIYSAVLVFNSLMPA